MICLTRQDQTATSQPQRPMIHPLLIPFQIAMTVAQVHGVYILISAQFAMLYLVNDKQLLMLGSQTFAIDKP